MPTLTLIRGLPGSGKSTLADRLTPLRGRNFEADQFFYQWDSATEENVYHFDPSKLSQAHALCQANTQVALSEDRDVVVSNTFTTIKEMQPYIDMAEQWGADLQVIHVQGPWKSEHDVPVETIQKMKDRWEDYDG